MIDVDDEYKAEAVKDAKDRYQETDNAVHDMYGYMVVAASTLAGSYTSGTGGAASLTATSDMGIN